jgi:outer membrane protein assembly factor BamA
MADLQASGRLDLRMLTPLVREAGLALAGRLEPRVQLTGSLDDLVLTGGLDLSGGELRLADPAVVVSQLEARAALTRGQVAVSSLSGTINGGTLTGAGELRYAPGVGGRFTADVAGMALNFPEGLRSEVDADVALAVTTETGENLPDGRLSGTVTVTRSAYREPLALVTGLLGALRNSVATAAAQSDSVFLDRLALDVRVVTDDDLVIRNNVARAQIGADLRVIGTASAPSLSGRAELREGGQLFLGRNIYTVQSGTIDFANPVTIEPNLGIVAGTRAGGEDIEIRIAGTPETLSTTLSSSSDPDLGQADITSLLLTGRRMEDLGSGQAAAVGAQVLGNVSGDVLGFAGRAIGLDTLRVGGVESSATRRDAADLAAEVDPTSRLTFGKSLGSNIDITLSQSLQQGDAQTWIIDYLPARQVALRLVSDDDDLRSYAFRHDLVFGAVPARLRSGSGPRAAPPRVSAIHLDGDLGFPREQILSRLRLTVGDRFDFVAWQDDRDRLERFYRTHRRLAARIGADRQESSDGTALTYAITAGPETAVVVRGATLSTRAVEEIETAWAESVFDGFLVEETEGIVRRELARGGYLQPSVQVALTDAGATRTLEVRVEPGAETRRTDVRLEGVDGPLRADLTEAATGLASGGQGVTAPRILGDGLVDYLRARGYPDATATVGAPVFDGVEVFVPVTVVTGPLFSLGVITVEGGSALDMDVLLGAVGLTTGDPHVPAAVAAARARLQGRYRLEGFSTASIQVRQQTQPAESSIDVAFVATEGPRQVVGELVITGNSSIEDSVVTRALRLPVGEPLRPADWLNARQRLFETGLFRRVDIALEPTSESEPETPATVVPMRVRVLLEEWPGLRLRYGFQVAEERPEEDVNGRDLVPGVTADLTRRTLFRRAITIGGAAQYERRERLGRLFLNTPTLWGVPLQSSVVLERSRREFRAETLVTDRTSASWEQRVRRGGLSLSYSLRFERNHTFDTEPQVNSFFPAFDETVNVARLTGSAAWDTRDDPADTTAGTLLSSTIEHASETLGSDVRFVRSLSQAYHFRTVGGVVLASAGRFGMVRPLGGQAVIPSQRFFAGGARTVRGVREDGLGGYDFLGAPLGGTTMLVFNQEVRFPVYRWIRGVVFLDAGGVGDLGDVAVSRLTGSGGIGLRVSTPFAVLRLDYGKTLWRGSSDDDGQWIFGIGHTF